MQLPVRINFQWPPAVMYCVTFVVLGALVFKKVLHPEILLAQLTWLAASPLDRHEKVAPPAEVKADSAS